MNKSSAKVLLAGLAPILVAIAGTALYRGSSWSDAREAAAARDEVFREAARAEAEREVVAARELAEAIARYRQENVSQVSLERVRLADAVALDLEVSIRWRADEPEKFAVQFPAPEAFASLVLEPKSREAANSVANGYPTVAEVFTGKRQKFVDDVKATIASRLAEAGVTIQAVTLSDISFPEVLTSALTQKALKEQELESIRQEKFVALERSKSAQEQAVADGQVEIAKAEAEGKAAEIAAKTEEKRRLSALAKAETEAQVVERKARAEAAKQDLLAASEAERQRKLGEVETAKVAKLKDIEMEKQRTQKEIEVSREKELAALCSGNPGYANFLVSKELASKVQIAVLPTGTDAGSLGGLMNTMMPGKLAANR